MSNLSEPTGLATSKHFDPMMGFPWDNKPLPELRESEQTLILNSLQIHYQQLHAWWQLSEIHISCLEGENDKINNEFKIAAVVCLPNRASVWDLFLFLLISSLLPPEVRIFFSGYVYFQTSAKPGYRYDQAFVNYLASPRLADQMQQSLGDILILRFSLCDRNKKPVKKVKGTFIETIQNCSHEWDSHVKYFNYDVIQRQKHTQAYREEKCINFHWRGK